MSPERTLIGTRAHWLTFATCDRVIRRDFYAFYAGFTVPTPSGADEWHRRAFVDEVLHGQWGEA